LGFVMTDSIEPTVVHGRYLLQERIARGGSADVWRARDQELDRSVAVKLLHPHLVPDETARRRLAGEARLAASLTHPGIVQVYDVLPEGETPALIMQLIDGESLDVRLARDGALAPRVAAGIGADVAEALAEAHRHGIIHRDVKPSNILIDGEGRAHLGDFGIAHSLAPDVERLTVAGTVVGTLAYIAPEQLAGGEVGPRTDLYGLGAVLFQMLTGRPPFEATSQLVLAQAQAAGPPEMPGVDPALADITRACLAIAPADRPPDADHVAAILRSIPTLNPAEREAETRVIPVAVPPAAPEEEVPLAGWWRRARPLVLGVAGLLLAVVLVAAILGPGKPAEGAGGLPTETPTPAWMVALMAEYSDACGATLDPASVAGLSQSDAEARVAALMADCTASPASSKAGGKGKGHGKP
jgi:serine/threonine-protein kinase